MLCNVKPINIDIYIRAPGKVLSVRPKPVRHYLFSVEKCRIVLSVIFRSYVRRREPGQKLRRTKGEGGEKRVKVDVNVAPGGSCGGESSPIYGPLVYDMKWMRLTPLSCRR